MNIINDNFLFTIDSIFSSGNILNEKSKKGNCQLFMYQTNCSRYSCNAAAYIAKNAAYVPQKEKVQKKKEEYNFQ
jgi:hypothetical protein